MTDLPERVKKEIEFRAKNWGAPTVARRHMEEVAAIAMECAARPEGGAWIPMKERQPADFERVLCVNDAGYMTTANRFHDTHLGSWNGSDYTAEEHQELVIGGITHWMPLPTSPTMNSVPLTQEKP